MRMASPRPDGAKSPTIFASAPEADVRAIAIYVAAQNRSPFRQANKPAAAQAQRGNSGRSGERRQPGRHVACHAANGDEGALIYAGACAGCHEGPRALPYGGIDLAL